jgi:uncharacterized protein (DUF1697 family)
LLRTGAHRNAKQPDISVRWLDDRGSERGLLGEMALLRARKLLVFRQDRWQNIATATNDNGIMSSTGYVAFLRGINVGGNSLLKMSELKKAFEELGFQGVTSVVASGNVVFRAEGKLRPEKKQLEASLAKTFGLPIVVILRTQLQISELIALNPFKKLSAQIKLQVSFLAEPIKPKGTFPTQLPAEDFKVVQVSPGEVISAVDLTSKARTPELMTFLEKQFGKGITTRTWNTLEKIDALLKANQ